MLFYPKSMVEAHPIPLSENSLAPTIRTIFPPIRLADWGNSFCL